MAQKINLIVDQGTTFQTSFTVNDEIGDPIDFTGFGVNAQLRKHYTSSNSVSFTASANSSGGVSLSLNSTQTTNLVAGRYVYDVEVTVGNTSPASISRVVEGIVTVTPNVTR